MGSVNLVAAVFGMMACLCASSLLQLPGKNKESWSTRSNESKLLQSQHKRCRRESSTTKSAKNLWGKDSFQSFIHYQRNVITFYFLSDYFSGIITHKYAKKQCCLSNSAKVTSVLLCSLECSGRIHLVRTIKELQMVMIPKQYFVRKESHTRTLRGLTSVVGTRLHHVF